MTEQQEQIGIKGFPWISEEKNLVAPCGNFCGACDLYRCGANGDTEGQERLAEFFNETGAKVYDRL